MATDLRERAPFKTPIAARDLVFTRPDGSSHPVTVQVGQPVADPEYPNSALCPFRVLGLPKAHGFVAGGADSMQALVLALEVLPDYLGAAAREHGGTLSWHGSSHLGFPHLNASREPNARA
jgi:hypothetical protein